MNYSVDVKFKNSVRRRTYLVTKEQYDILGIGSHVIVDSPSQGYIVVKVGARCKAKAPPTATKYIVDIVDDADYKERTDVNGLNTRISVLEGVIEAQEAEITRLKNDRSNMKKSYYAVLYGHRGPF